MVANVWVSVGIVSPAHCGQQLFPLPVSMAAILNSVGGRCREMSGNGDSVISKSGLVENVGEEVEIASLSQANSKVIAASVFTAAILDLQLSVARDGIGSSTVGSLDLENWGVAVGISFLYAIELEICLGSVATPSGLRVSEKGSGL